MGSTDDTGLQGAADVDIDKTGRFKYVLIKVTAKNGSTKHIVRGYSFAAYHADVFEHVFPKMQSLGLKADCEGGGRIEHNPSSKTILVYGYSVGFGRADHSIAVEKLKEAYPDYSSITFSDDGY